MSLNKSFDDNLNEWQALADNLKPHLNDLPNLAADQGALSSLIPQIRDSQAQENVQEANLRGAVSQRRDLATQARKARNRLVAGLQSAFSHENDKLLAFGIKPRIRRSSLRLTKVQKAQMAATRAMARAAELAAAQQPAAQAVPTASTPAVTK